MSNADNRAVLYDGLSAGAIAAQLGVPRVELLEAVSSTQDVAHALAAGGAPAGTLVLADEQTSAHVLSVGGWTSPLGAGVWLTVVERPTDPAAVDVLSLRVGMAIARALDAFTTEAVRLKWPNDVYTGGRKLAGLLAEARWRDGAVEWVSLGVGIIARRHRSLARRTASETTRLDVLRECAAAACGGSKRRPPERCGARRVAARDLAVGCGCLEPAAGRVVGIDARRGTAHRHRVAHDRRARDLSFFRGGSDSRLRRGKPS